jgi:hypothetical protein
MQKRFPLIFNTETKQIEELSSGDNLSLEGNSIVDAKDIIVTGNINTESIIINGNTLSTVAFSNDYNDLLNAPSQFSGSYRDLTQKPFIPTQTSDLLDIDSATPNNNDVLFFNEATGSFEPRPITLDLTANSLSDLDDVNFRTEVNGKFLKFYEGSWRASKVSPADLVSLNLIPISTFDNDAEFVSRNESVKYQEQLDEPEDPRPGDEWFDSFNKKFYKYLGGHWVLQDELFILVTGDNFEIRAENGDAFTWITE